MSQNKPTIVQRLIGKLPDEIKRLLFGVVVFQVCLKGSAERRQLESLNQELKLARSDSALEFPSLCYSSLGIFSTKHRERLLELVANNDLPSDVCTSLACTIPDWLKYAKADRIAGDIERIVIEARKNLTHSSIAV